MWNALFHDLHKFPVPISLTHIYVVRAIEVHSSLWNQGTHRLCRSQHGHTSRSYDNFVFLVSWWQPVAILKDRPKWSSAGMVLQLIKFAGDDK